MLQQENLKDSQSLEWACQALSPTGEPRATWSMLCVALAK